MNKIIKNNQGATAILFTMLVLSAMLFVALTASNIIQNGLKMSQAHLNSTKAYYGAEAGAEKVLWEIRKNGQDPIENAWDGSGGQCIEFDAYPSGVIHPDHTALCNTVSSDIIKQELDNEVIYRIEYSYSGGRVRFKNVGNYHDVTQRVVEVTYVDN
ncbi:hypothetical protein C0583_03660 [Candidatus Parcubacteria bacterium]|nr:MAG: hypothetical protein C0583_03660 [Candidatus Parcubacteria bacterium]